MAELGIDVLIAVGRRDPVVMAQFASPGVTVHLAEDAAGAVSLAAGLVEPGDVGARQGLQRDRAQRLRAGAALSDVLSVASARRAWRLPVAVVTQGRRQVRPHLIVGLCRAQSAVRGYQAALRFFCDYVTEPRSGWPAQCRTRFGRGLEQVCHDWSTDAHLVGLRRRPGMPPDDPRGDPVRRGLRCSEASALDVTDFHPHEGASELGRFGSLYVWAGKGAKGLPPRRWTVPSVMPWAVEAVQDYLADVRPRYRTGHGPALWLTCMTSLTGRGWGMRRTACSPMTGGRCRRRRGWSA
ncbi:hypothetical protein ACQEVF_24215 [Nonomuraea polychroma]|uniref:hypothetical protein n=1 Tax=Nonomuraea polychroma TaxID=46176 RepID=UPI003D8FC309